MEIKIPNANKLRDRHNRNSKTAPALSEPFQSLSQHSNSVNGCACQGLRYTRCDFSRGEYLECHHLRFIGYVIDFPLMCNVFHFTRAYTVELIRVIPANQHRIVCEQRVRLCAEYNSTPDKSSYLECSWQVPLAHNDAY